MSTSPPRADPRKQPEKKFGPHAGGIGVAVWLNTIETADGRREMRSITIAPRRYRDKQTGEWKDSGSYRPSDIPLLLSLLMKAMDYVYTTPLPDQSDDGEELPPADIPF